MLIKATLQTELTTKKKKKKKREKRRDRRSEKDKKDFSDGSCWEIIIIKQIHIFTSNILSNDVLVWSLLNLYYCWWMCGFARWKKKDLRYACGILRARYKTGQAWYLTYSWKWIFSESMPSFEADRVLQCHTMKSSTELPLACQFCWSSLRRCCCCFSMCYV